MCWWYVVCVLTLCWCVADYVLWRVADYVLEGG